MTPAITSPLFAHRYLAGGSIEFVCMNCLDVVCKVQFEEDAAALPHAHACKSEKTECKTYLLTAAMSPVPRQN
jgi:hypothetical protein